MNRSFSRKNYRNRFNCELVVLRAKEDRAEDTVTGFHLTFFMFNTFIVIVKINVFVCKIVL